MAPTTKSKPPAQYQQPSRKGKKAWRKNVDITKVQEGLEQVRDEVIQGGVIAEKPSSELFVVDTAGDAAVRKRIARLVKPLKADEIIARRSAVPAVSSRIVKPVGVTDGVIERSAKKQRTGVSRAHYERLRKRAYGGEAVEKDIVKRNDDAPYDPWMPLTQEKDPQLSFLDPAKPIREPSTLKEAPISLLRNAKPLPAVVKPRAGTSYNPLFEEWDALLAKEGTKAVEAEQKRLEAERLEQEQAEKIAAATREAEEWATEDESAWEGLESASEAADEDHRVTRMPRRKTPAERNRIKRRKEREGQAKHAAAMRRQVESAIALKEEQQTIDQTTAQAAVTALGKDGDDAEEEEFHERVLRRRMLGKARIPAPDLELTLPDELQDSLRRLQPEGNLLRDRFHSLMVRGRVETRRPNEQRKRAKRTETEKWTHKDVEIPGLVA